MTAVRTRVAKVPAAGQLTAAADWTEAEFQRHVVKLATDNGWGLSVAASKHLDEDLASYRQPPAPLDGLVFHPRIMYRSEPGWPDLTLIRRRDRRLVFAELKTERRESKVTPRQEKVLDLLRSIEWPRCMCNGPLRGITFGARQAADGKLHDSGCALIGGAFSGMATRIQVFVWRPRDLAEIAEVLA